MALQCQQNNITDRVFSTYIFTGVYTLHCQTLDVNNATSQVFNSTFNMYMTYIDILGCMFYSAGVAVHGICQQFRISFYRHILWTWYYISLSEQDLNPFLSNR